MVNPQLFRIAADTVQRQKSAAFREKTAFQPPEDPSQAGGPGQGTPGSPAGAPPGAGGAPPADPAAAGGGPNPMDMIQQQMQQMQQQMMQMQGGGAAGGMGGPMGAAKTNKQDQQAAVSMDMFVIKKLLFMMCNSMGIEIPPSLLDGPNRDPNTGAVMPPGTPGSTSDPQVMQQDVGQQQQGGAGGEGGGQEQQSAIPPIQPMQGAMPQQGKTASAAMGEPFGKSNGVSRIIQDKASALATLLRGRG